MAFAIIPFIIEIAASYLLSRLTAPDGPRLKELGATGGDYGIPMPRAYGETVRAPGIFMAMSDIDEDKHKAGGNSTLISAGIGAATGFVYGGPVGTVVGAIAGGLFGSASQQYYYTYSIPALALMLCDRTDDDPIEDIEKVWANGKLIWKKSSATVDAEEFDADGVLIWRRYKRNKYFHKLTIYTGHTDQPVDPILAGQQEISETSGYPFTAYIMIDDLQLADFGNAPPTIEVLFNVKSGQSLAEAAEKICAASGINPETSLSSTALTSDSVRGYLVNEESSCWDALKPLLPVFGVDAAEVSGQIRFYRRSQTMRATLVPDDMGAYVYGDSPPDRYQFKRSPDVGLPQETALTFVDPDRDYQTNTATANRVEGDAKSNLSVNLPLVLTADEGASAAALMHWDAWLGRTSLNFSLTDAWISLATGLAYGLPVAGDIVPYRVTRRTRGANGIIEVEALSDESVTYTANVAGDSGLPPDDPSTDFAETVPVLMDMPLLSDSDDEYGFYVAMGASEADWQRGRVEATANGTVWASIADGPTEAIMGDVTGTLAAGTTTGLDDTLDTTTVLTVVLSHEGLTLSSATDAELDGWRNFAFVGKDGLGEYLQFKTATFVSGATWQLTNLRRGRRGTDHAITTHASGEKFVLLDDGAGIFRVKYSTPDEWGDTLTVRGVTLHQDEADAATQTFANTGEGKRPFSPVNVDGTWDGSNNLTITWDYRSRLFAGTLGIDDRDEYEVEITSGAGRIITVSAAETTTYTAAQQTADGATPGDTVTGRIKQNSDVNDGRWRNFTIVGPNDGLFLEDDITPLELEDGSDFELG